MQDTENHTPPQRISQMTHEEIVSGVKRIIATKFSDKDIADLQSWLRGVASVANRRARNDQAT